VIDLMLGQERFGPSDWIVGTVVTRAAIEVRSLEVLVSLYEETDDYKEAALTGRTGPLHFGPVAAGAAFPFRLQLPPQVVPPYRCEWGELYWEVDAKADIARGADLHARRRILVLPPGVAEDQLGSAPPSARPGVLTTMAQAAGIEVGAATAPAASTAPGWYADPWLEKRLRWWDGERWTAGTAD
jgi:hypothetical protein